MTSYIFERNGYVLAVERENRSVRVWVDSNARGCFGDSGLVALYMINDFEEAKRFAKEIGATRILEIAYEKADEA